MLSPTNPQVIPHGKSQLIEINGDSTQNPTALIEKFKKERGIGLVLAFSGGADDDNPLIRHIVSELEAEERLPTNLKAALKTGLNQSVDNYIATIIRDILMPLSKYRIAVLSGGTKWGVPRVAVQVACQCNLPTIGVYPLLARDKHAIALRTPDDELTACRLDLAVCVHPQVYRSEWGDEAGVFTKMLDSVVVIGGGAGTAVEIARILKLNERKEIAMKHIVPVSGTGGTADRTFPGKLKTMAACMPHHHVTTGEQVLEYLKDANVVTDDIREPA